MQVEPTKSSREDTAVCNFKRESLHLYSWYGSNKLCFLPTPSKNEQNQKKKHDPRTVASLGSQGPALDPESGAPASMERTLAEYMAGQNPWKPLVNIKIGGTWCSSAPKWSCRL